MDVSPETRAAARSAWGWGGRAPTTPKGLVGCLGRRPPYTSSVSGTDLGNSPRCLRCTRPRVQGPAWDGWRVSWEWPATPVNSLLGVFQGGRGEELLYFQEEEQSRYCLRSLSRNEMVPEEMGAAGGGKGDSHWVVLRVTAEPVWQSGPGSCVPETLAPSGAAMHVRV